MALTARTVQVYIEGQTYCANGGRRACPPAAASFACPRGLPSKNQTLGFLSPKLINTYRWPPQASTMEPPIWICHVFLIVFGSFL